MNHKKLFLYKIPTETLRAIAAHLAQVANLCITKFDTFHIIVSMRYLDDLEAVVEKCQELAGKPLEVRMDHHVRAAT